MLPQSMESFIRFPWGDGKDLHFINRFPDDGNPFAWLTLLLSEPGNASDLNIPPYGFFPLDGVPADDILRILTKKEANPKAGKNGQKESKQAEIQPPDISNGLGNSQVKRDLNDLGRFVKGKAHWMVYQKCLYIYQEACWRKVDMDDAISEIRDICSVYPDIAETLVDSDYKKVYLELLHDPELKVKGEISAPPHTVNFRDGELDFMSTPLHIQRSNPMHHFMSSIDVSCRDVLNPPTPGETFERFIRYVSGGDETIRTQILELLAIALTGDQLKHFYVIYGPSNSGKSQWGRFMRELLGKDQVEAVRGAHDFGDRWTTGSLKGKKLALCSDLPNKVLPSNAVGMIKQFCGDDPMKGEEKYANSFTYDQKALLLFIGNYPIQLPRADQDEAFWNRMIVIPFMNPVREENMELNLFQKFKDESPYIIHEAIKAYQALAERNFVLTRSEIPGEFRQNGIYGFNTVRDFIEGNLEEQSDQYVSTRELYEAFCSQSSQDMPLTTFSRALASVVQSLFPHAVPAKRTNSAGERGYKNLGFVHDDEA